MKISTFILIAFFIGIITKTYGQTKIEAETADAISGTIKVNNAGSGLDGIKQPASAKFNSISVASTGQYKFYYNTSGFQASCKIILKVDGVEKGIAHLKSTGAWGTYENSDTLAVDLTAGNHAFTIEFGHDDANFTGYLCNIDYFVFESADVKTGIKELNSEEVKIFPIPAKNQLNVELAKTAKISLFDLNGKKYYENKSTKTITTIPVSNCLPGIYLLKLETDSGILTRRIVVQ